MRPTDLKFRSIRENTPDPAPDYIEFTRDGSMLFSGLGQQ